MHDVVNIIYLTRFCFFFLGQAISRPLLHSLIHSPSRIQAHSRQQHYNTNRHACACTWYYYYYMFRITLARLPSAPKIVFQLVGTRLRFMFPRFLSNIISVSECMRIFFSILFGCCYLFNIHAYACIAANVCDRPATATTKKQCMYIFIRNAALIYTLYIHNINTHARTLHAIAFSPKKYIYNI